MKSRLFRIVATMVAALCLAAAACNNPQQIAPVPTVETIRRETHSQRDYHHWVHSRRGSWSSGANRRACPDSHSHTDSRVVDRG